MKIATIVPQEDDYRYRKVMLLLSEDGLTFIRKGGSPGYCLDNNYGTHKDAQSAKDEAEKMGYEFVDQSVLNTDRYNGGIRIYYSHITVGGCGFICKQA
jgi:hypothetical protein